MSEIFNEANMQQALEKYIPNGESLLAGIHALSHETDIKCLLGKCVYSEDRLIPDENGYIISLKTEVAKIFRKSLLIFCLRMLELVSR